MKKLLALLLVLALALSPLAGAVWYEEAAQRLTEEDVVHTREPLGEDRYISLIQFTALLCRAKGLYYDQYDLPWPDFYREVALVNGLTDLVAEGDLYGTVARYDAVKMVYDAFQGSLTAFDAAQVSDCLRDYRGCPQVYKTALGQLYLNGVVTGRSDHTFDGWEGLTVYEALALLDRAIHPEQRVEPYLPDFSYLLAQYSTRTNTVANRNFNVNRACESINGTVLGPGEQFSFNAVVGRASGYNGYRAATVIRGGKYVEGYGGGVCQDATTLFNAALLANLTIDQRAAHGLKSFYVKPGWDATISYPTLDLKFTNPYDCPIKLAGDYNSATHTLTFRVYAAQPVYLPKVELYVTGGPTRYTLFREADGVLNYQTQSRYK